MRIITTINGNQQRCVVLDDDSQIIFKQNTNMDFMEILRKVKQGRNNYKKDEYLALNIKEFDLAEASAWLDVKYRGVHTEEEHITSGEISFVITENIKTKHAKAFVKMLSKLKNKDVYVENVNVIYPYNLLFNL